MTSVNLYSQNIENTEDDSFFEQEDLISFVDDFINLPPGGTPWQIFGETQMDEYPIVDKDGNEWIGVRPKFTEKICKT